MNNSMLHRRIREEEEWNEDNGWETDPYEELLSECGMTRDGGCMYAGSEYCDLDCPFDKLEDPGEYLYPDIDEWEDEEESEPEIYNPNQLNLFESEES